ncbi:MAG: tetratricopeptide repeat protein [Methanosarcinaceae archaeon]|nr:tetratricopeptide repeat protein [Methanosarcinaceae archaeon]
MSDREKASEWIDKGIVLQKLRKYEEALEAFNKAIEFEPEDAFAWCNKGIVLQKLRKYEEALEAFKKAIEINPEYIKELHRKGISLNIKIKPNIEVLLNKGDSLYNRGMYGEALKAYEEAIKIKPKYFSAWYNKGIILLKLNKYDKALKAFDKAIEIKPEYGAAWCNKGVALGELQRGEDALEAFNKAIEFEPEDALAWCNKGIVLIELERYWEALEASKKAVDLNQKSAFPLAIEGLSLKKLKMYEEAMETFEKAIKIDDPENFYAWVFKGDLLNELNRYEKAREIYKTATEYYPENAFTWVAKGDFYLNLGIYNYSLKFYEKAISLEPKNPLLLVRIARVKKGISLLKLKKYHEAQEALNKAFNYDPQNYNICNHLAEYYLMFGDLKKASEYTEKALFIDKKNAHSLYLKGKIKLEEQDYTISAKCFYEANSLDLGNPNYLQWGAYAKYLMAELKYGSNEKRYQDTILGIIRDFEKIDIFNSQEKDAILYDLILNPILKIIPCNLKYFSLNSLTFVKRSLILLYENKKLNFNFIKKFILILLQIINPLLTIYENKKIIAYNYYFLGCFYYKINDNITAYSYLKKCNNLISDSKTENTNSKIIDNILKSSIWKWWLYFPSNHYIRSISFLVLVFALFLILLPSLASELFAYNFLSFIDWNRYTVPLTFLIIIILSILAYPNIQNIKSSQIEIELRPPFSFDFTPSLIEKNLKALEFDLQRRDSKK